MADNSGSQQPIQWQSPTYVDSWLANSSRQRGYQPMRERLVSLLPFQPGAAIRVLDIGGGDGALSLEVVRAYPKAQVVCHDFSEAMLDRARQRLAEFPEAVSFVRSDLRDPTWTRVIQGAFDAVVSCIAIHNVAERSQGATERIREVCGEIFRVVKPGGCFLNYDYVTAPGPVLERIYLKERLCADQARLKIETGVEKSLQELEREYHEQRHGRGGPLSEPVGPRYPDTRDILHQLEWLRQAGFDEVDCIWKDTRRAIFGGFRH